LFAAVGLTTAFAQAPKDTKATKQPTKVDDESKAAPKATAPKKDDAPKAPAKAEPAKPAAPAAPKATTAPAAAPAPAPATPAATAPAAPPPAAKKPSAAATALAKQIRDAKQSFAAPNPASMNAPWGELQRAAKALDAHLKQLSPDNAAAWRTFLKFDALAVELQKRDVPVDVDVLTGVHDRLTAGYEGLEKKPYRDAAEAINAYLASTSAAGNPNVRQDFERTLDELADAVAAVGDDGPDNAQAAVIGRTVGWLKRNGQAADVVEAVTAKYSQPNLLVDVNEAFISDLVGSKVDQVEPVRDVILGTNIRGTGRTVGEVTVDVVDSPDQAVLTAFFQGTNHSKTVGYNRSAVIHSVGTTQLQGRTTLYFNENGLAVSPSTARATVSNKIVGIGSTKGGCVGKIVVKVASKQAPQKQPQAQQIGARHAEQRLSKRLTDEAATMVADANADYQRRVRAPLERFNAVPRLINVSSSDERMMVRVLQDRAARLAAPGPAPQPAAGSGFVARLHHSLIDNTAEQALAGRRFDRERLVDLAQNQMGIEVPPSDDDTPFSITFADRDPVTVALENGEVAVTLRGKKFTNEDKTYDGWNITARYKTATTGDGLKLTREGDLVIYPPNFRPGTDKLSLGQTTFRRILQRRFDKMLPAEVVSEGVVLENGRGTLVVSQLQVDNGWAVLGWNRKPAAPVAGAE
jgi:hypothetical protein